MWQNSAPEQYQCDLSLQCFEGSYFSQFLHVLLLRLAFSFVLVHDTSNQTILVKISELVAKSYQMSHKPTQSSPDQTKPRELGQEDEARRSRIRELKASWQKNFLQKIIIEGWQEESQHLQHELNNPLQQKLTLTLKSHIAAQAPCEISRGSATLCGSSVYSVCCGQLLAVGGRDRDEKYSNNIYLYHTKINCWEDISHMPTPQSWCLAIVLLDNKLMVMGGESCIINICFCSV